MTVPTRRQILMCATVLASLCLLWVGLPVGADAAPLGAAHRPPDLRRTVTFLAELQAALRPTCLETWGHQFGLSIDWSAGDSWVTITGSAPALQRAFGVSLRFKGSDSGGAVWSASGTPRIPLGACGELAGIGLIHSALKPKLESGLSKSVGGLGPAQLLAAYDASPLGSMNIKGQGETVVLFEADAYNPSDVQAFANAIGAPLALSTPYGNLGKHQGESTMDIETVHEIVPRATIVDVDLESSKFSGASTGAIFASAFDAARKQWPGSVWSLSLGLCESDPGAFNATDLAIMEKAVTVAEGTGTSVFASSGDAGGLDCSSPAESGTAPQGDWQGVVVPAALPAVTGVGGTSLFTTASGQRLRETSWTETLLSQGSGGGMSTRFPVPSWQAKALSAGGGTGGREVPDVSADADPATGNTIIENGDYVQGGGTSLASPIWAGFVSMIDQYLGLRGKPPLGFLNPALYGIASGGVPYPGFHDITVGGNDVAQTARGYDPVTGLGSPDVWNLARDLLAMRNP